MPGGQLTLLDAVNAAQEGLDWRDREVEQNRAKKIRANTDAANKAGADVLSKYARQQPAGLGDMTAAPAATPAQPAQALPAATRATPPAAAPANNGQVSTPLGDGGAAGATAFPVAPTLGEADASAAPTPAVTAPLPQSAPATVPLAAATAAATPAAAAATGTKPAAGRYTPQPEHLLEAFDARGKVFADNGDWKGWTENFAQSAGIRTQIRNKVIDAAMGGIDPKTLTQDQAISLAQQVYPTIQDGKTVTMAKKNEDGTVSISTGDGKTLTTLPANIYMTAQRARMDPAKVAEYEYQTMLAEAKEGAKTKGQIKVEAAKSVFKKDEQAQKYGFDLGLHTLDNDASLQRTQTTAGATLGAAGIHAGATVNAATIRADATRDAATTGLKGQKDGLSVAQKWQDMAKTHFGKVAGGLMGSSRVAGQATLDLAATAQRIHEANNGRITETQALDAAAKYLKLKSPSVGLDSLDDN